MFCISMLYLIRKLWENMFVGALLCYFIAVYSFISISRPIATNRQTHRIIILLRTLLGSCSCPWLIAASIIIIPSPAAASGVSKGNKCNRQGSIRPAEAHISLMPIKRTRWMGRSTTPVCLVSISFCLEKVDFAKPTNRKVIASIICAIQSAVFIFITFQQSSTSYISYPLTIVKNYSFALILLSVSCVMPR